MFSLKVASPEEIMFENEVDFVALPGKEGQLGILPNHAPLLSALREGQIKIEQPTGTKIFNISGGFVEVLNNKVTVLIK